MPEAVALLKSRIGDEHPRVRLEAVRACSFFPADEVMEAALEAGAEDIVTNSDGTIDVRTPREREILQVRLQGATFDDIGEKLNINQATARRAIQRLIDRLVL